MQQSRQDTECARGCTRVAAQLVEESAGRLGGENIVPCAADQQYRRRRRGRPQGLHPGQIRVADAGEDFRLHVGPQVDLGAQQDQAGRLIQPQRGGLQRHARPHAMSHPDDLIIRQTRRSLQNAVGRQHLVGQPVGGGVIEGERARRPAMSRKIEGENVHPGPRKLTSCAAQGDLIAAKAFQQ